MGMPITTKGQVTIPKPMRDHLGLHPGSEVTFTLEPDGRVVLSKVAEAGAELTPAERIARVRGIARSTMTTDEIMLLLRGEPE
jgi:AbrB family looped-hinge helix DNA binding protein